MNTSSRKQLANEFRDPEQRHLYVESQIETGLPLQLRAMREQRGWNQTTLAEKAKTTQNAISRLESPGRSGHPSIQTLLRMAKVFDVALVVGFVPFSRFLDIVSGMDRNSVAVPSFDNDPGMIERKQPQDDTVYIPRAKVAGGDHLPLPGPTTTDSNIASPPSRSCDNVIPISAAHTGGQINVA